MNYEVLSRPEIEQREFSSKAGMLAVYACGCGEIIVYLFQDPGEVPGRIICAKCKVESMFRQFNCRQPTRVWYRPKDVTELMAVAKAAHKYTGEGTIKEIFENYVEHYNLGGLFSKEISWL